MFASAKKTREPSSLNWKSNGRFMGKLVISVPSSASSTQTRLAHWLPTHSVVPSGTHAY